MCGVALCDSGPDLHDKADEIVSLDGEKGGHETGFGGACDCDGEVLTVQY